MVIANIAYAQRIPEEVWNQLFDAGWTDVGYSIAVEDTAPDADYNVWVGGTSKSESGFDWRIIKYDNDGKEIWNRTYDTDNIACKDMFVFTDNSNDISTGSIFGTGDSYNGSNYDFRTVKFDSEGEEIWSATYDGGDHDIATAVGTSDKNSVYVGGNSFNGSNYDWCMVKYDNSGNELWHKTFDFEDSDDFLSSLMVTYNPEVFAAGYFYNGSDFDCKFLHLDSNGNVIGNKTYDSGGNDFAYDITAFMPLTGKNNSNALPSAYDNAVSKPVYIYVAGALNNGSDDDDCLILKYDSKGNLLWHQEYDSGKNDFLYAIDVDAKGDVYAAGCSKDENNSDLTIFKYSPDGNLIWNMIYDSGGDEAKYTADIKVSKKTGFIYVTFDDISGSGYLTDENDNIRTIKFRQFFTVSGTIKENGSGMKDVMVVLSGSVNDTTYTDADGTYTFSDLPCGTDYTITPYKERYKFTPFSYTYTPLNSDKPDQDFVGTRGIGIAEESEVEDIEVIKEVNKIVVKYSLDKNSRVDIMLFNALGSVVNKVSGYETSGNHTYTFI